MRARRVKPAGIGGQGFGKGYLVGSHQRQQDNPRPVTPVAWQLAQLRLIGIIIRQVVVVVSVSHWSKANAPGAKRFAQPVEASESRL